MSEFSEYIVYVDESGDHGLVGIDQPCRAIADAPVKEYSVFKTNAKGAMHD